MFSQLREAISDDHIAIEKTPFAVAMAAGSIDRDDYLYGLAQLYFIHAALEDSVAATSVLKPFFNEKMVRTSVIERDLAHFDRQIEEYAALPETQAITAEIVRLARCSPLDLLAYIYVLEGSRMGSLMLAKPVAQALHVQAVENQGIDYHVEGARETPMRLRAWKESVSEVAWGAAQFDAILAAASRFMKDLCQLYAVLPVAAYTDQQVA
jgi:heme oxygenase